MNKILFVFIITVTFVIAFTSTVSANSLYDNNTKLYTISTTNFDIVYSEKSKDTAYYVASIAEDVLTDMNQHLSNKTLRRITVVISSDMETANGMSTPVPYNCILLYDHIPETGGSIDGYSNWIKDLFTHELVHSISLTLRGPMWETGAKIFGNWVVPQMIIHPMFMVEGVTVSFESLEGYGRVNNPYIAHQIWQDIIEGRPKTISQATGAYNIYPYGQTFYHYGGYFSAYLQQKYGMEKYRQLWHQTGKGIIFTLLPGAFRKVYGVRIRDEWKNFYKYIQVKQTIETNTNRLLKRLCLIKSPVAVGNRIFYIDGFNREIRVYDTTTGMDGLILYTDYLVDTIDVKKDGSTILISGSYLKNNLYKLVVREYDMHIRRYTKRQLFGVREAVYFNQEILAVKIKGHISDIVLIDDNKQTTLLYGDPNRILAAPKAIDNNRFAYIAKQHGINQIVIYNTQNAISQVLNTTVETTPLFLENDPTNAILLIPKTNIAPQQAVKIKYIRDISVANTKIYFSYNNGEGLHKLGFIDLDNQKITLQTNNISGGVFAPLEIRGQYYYTAKFSKGDMLMKLPDLKHRKETDYNTTTISDYKSFENSTKDNNTYNQKPYRNGKYLLPHVWLPIFIPSAKFDNIGIFTYLADPIQANIITPIITFNFYEYFPNINIFWKNRALPVNFSVGVNDELIYSTYSSNYYRFTIASATASYQFNIIPVTRYLYLSTRFSYQNYAFETVPDSHPYTWTYGNGQLINSTYLSYSTLVKKARIFDYRGWRLSTYIDYNFYFKEAKNEWCFIYTPNFLRVFVQLFGGYGTSDMFFVDGLNVYFSGNYYLYLPSFDNVAILARYYLSTHIYFPVFNIEIQQGLGLFPLYFNRIYVIAGYRGAYLDNPNLVNLPFEEKYFHSAYLSLNLATTVYYNFPMGLYVDVSYAINKQVAKEEDKFSFRFGMNLNIGVLSRAGSKVEPNCLFDEM